MSFDADTLYNLLPAVFRIRDQEQGEPLKALVSVVAEQVAVLEENLNQLYDDQFIETCAGWAVPYIGDLIGAKGLYELTRSTFSQRAQVANTIGYRKRKGTASVLEQMAGDVTGWDARAVEFFRLLITTENLNHLRLSNLATIDLRQWEPLERLGKAFESSAHTADVRNTSPTSGKTGKYNIPNIGIFLWRLKGYSVTDSLTPSIFSNDYRRFMFSPLGNNSQLYSRSPDRQEGVAAQRIQPEEVAMPISRAVLDSYKSLYYGEGKSLALLVDENPVSDSDIAICNLSDSPGGGWGHPPKDKYSVDPVLGRLVLPEKMPSGNAPGPTTAVKVSYHYGFSMDMGGGEYERIQSFDSFPNSENIKTVPSSYATIEDALAALNGSGVVEIGESGKGSLRLVDTPAINVAAGVEVEIRGANLTRPTLVINDEVKISGNGKGSILILDGLLINGGKSNTLRVKGNLDQLILRHCTLVPGLGLNIDGSPLKTDATSIIIETADTTVTIDSCITGALRIASNSEAKVSITNSIVDAGTESSVAYSGLDGVSAGGGMAKIENCTFIGKVHAETMTEVSNSIFASDLAEIDSWSEPVISERRQEGCVRFSFVPFNSLVPRRYNCRPATMEEVLAMQPKFTSMHYGESGYCQLNRCCPGEIRQGADDQSEMGAFHDLFQPWRQTNLRVCLDEYMRFGLNAGIFYES